MHDRFPKRNNPTHEGQVLTPPGWLSVDELEDLLKAAIDANQGDESGALAEIDEYFRGRRDLRWARVQASTAPTSRVPLALPCRPPRQSASRRMIAPSI